MFYKYEKHGWKGQLPNTKNMKAGKLWENDIRDDIKLPEKDKYGEKITYREFDVNSTEPGKKRDTERFVVGGDGSIYYTDSHYKNFIKIK